jgi:hypothetical protein
MTSVALALVVGIFALTLLRGDRFMLSWASFGCGLLGGFVSIQQRLKRLTDEELELLSSSWFQIVLIPIYWGRVRAGVVRRVPEQDGRRKPLPSLLKPAFFAAISNDRRRPEFLFPHLSNHRRGSREAPVLVICRRIFRALCAPDTARVRGEGGLRNAINSAGSAANNPDGAIVCGFRRPVLSA